MSEESANNPSPSTTTTTTTTNPEPSADPVITIVDDDEPSTTPDKTSSSSSSSSKKKSSHKSSKATGEGKDDKAEGEHKEHKEHKSSSKSTSKSSSKKSSKSSHSSSSTSSSKHKHKHTPPAAPLPEAPVATNTDKKRKPSKETTTSKTPATTSSSSSAAPKKPCEDETHIPEWNFFEHLIGHDEDALRKRLDTCLKPTDEPQNEFHARFIPKAPRFPSEGRHFYLHHIDDEALKYDAGQLFFPSVGELSAATKRGPLPNEPAGTSPAALSGSGGSEEKRTWLHLQTNTKGESMHLVDVAQLQAAPENRGALFQVASNMNTVEAATENSMPDSDDFVTVYLNDKTQGPIASVSAAPAAIARVYTPFYDGIKANREEWGQSQDKQISMLYELPEYYTVSNGYIVNYGGESVFEEKDIDSIVRRIHLGLHTNVQVVFGKREGGFMECLVDGDKAVKKPRKEPIKPRKTEPQIISQITCAGMNLNQGQSGADNKKLPKSDVKARALLRAAYQGAYYAALSLGCKKLYLTLVGGGVFGNPLSVIFDEIVRAHRDIGMSRFNRTLEDVYLIFYSMPPAKDFNEFVSKLREEKVPFDSNEGHVERNEGDPNKKRQFLDLCVLS